MKITAKIMELKWEAKNPIHIGKGMLIGNTHLTMDYIPGTSIKGAIGNNFLKLFCINNEFAICTKGGNCKKCKFPDIFLNNSHGSGVYFHSFIPEDYRLENQYSVTIDPDTKSSKTGELYNYQKLVIISKDNTMKLIMTDTIDEEIVEKIKTAININLQVGSRKSWGWGIINIKSIKTKDIEILEKNSTSKEKTFKIELKSPFPITERNFDDTLKKGFRDLAKGFQFDDYQDFTKINYQRYEIKPISTRSEINTKVIRNMAVTPPFYFELFGTSKNEFVLKLGQIFGVTTSNSPWTKTGYGLIKLV